MAADEASCTLDAEAGEWIVVRNGKTTRSKIKPGVQYETVGNSRPPKWSRTTKGNSVPGPRMGASPSTPKSKSQGGPYVACQTRGCPGLHGRASYCYLQVLEEAQEELFCTACATPWAWSKQQATKAGQIPSLRPNAPSPKAKSKKPGVSVEPVIPSGPSPFVESGEPGESNAPPLFLSQKQLLLQPYP